MTSVSDHNSLPNVPLGEAQIAAVVEALRTARGSQPSKAELRRAVHWIEQVCINAGLVEGILGGQMGVRFPLDSDPLLSLTTKGIARVESMLGQAKPL